MARHRESSVHPPPNPPKTNLKPILTNHMLRPRGKRTLRRRQIKHQQRRFFWVSYATQGMQVVESLLDLFDHFRGNCGVVGEDGVVDVGSEDAGLGGWGETGNKG